MRFTLLISSFFLVLFTSFSLCAQDSLASEPEPVISQDTPGPAEQKETSPNETTISEKSTESETTTAESPETEEPSSKPSPEKAAEENAAAPEAVNKEDADSSAEKTVEESTEPKTTAAKIPETEEPPGEPPPEKAAEENVAAPETGDIEDADSSAKKTVEASDDMDIIVEEDEDLFLVDDEEELIIADESEENILVEEKIAEDTLSADTALQQETVQQEPKEQVDQPDTGITETETEKPDESIEVVGEEEQKEEVKPIVIEKTRSIDFAKNLKEYRSPKRAMFMSLLLPGLGQAYTKRYWKTALFGVIEAAIIGFSIKYHKDAKDKTEDARDFADDRFSYDKFEDYYKDFETFAGPESISVDDITILFGDTLANYTAKYKDIATKSHEYKYRQEFDRDIQYDIFVQGWKDCEPPFYPDDGFDTTVKIGSYSFESYNSDTTWMLNMFKELGDGTKKLISSGVFGYSPDQNTYNHMISLSNRYDRIAKNLLFFLVANHMASAIDAFISARAFNDRLMNEKSVWQRINIDHQIAFTQTGVTSQLGIRVRF